MSDGTGIEWTDATWNPVTGCTKVSPGCDHCYAETFAERFRGTPGHHFEQGFDVVLRPERLELPLRWRAPRRIFVNSMSDLFLGAIPVPFIAKAWAVMSLARQHTFQILTKRQGRMKSLLNGHEFQADVMNARTLIALERGLSTLEPMPWPLPNVWLGVSVEDQQRADLRIPALRDTPAAVRFLSCEPLLGPIDLRNISVIPGHVPGYDATSHLDWVIAGGESGRGARPMHPNWARSLRDQCTGAGVAFLFKQWGEWGYTGDGATVIGRSIETANQRWLPGASSAGPFTHSVMERMGKKKAGRVLDGRTWDEYPTAVPA